jgi:hypothetical protein
MYNYHDISLDDPASCPLVCRNLWLIEDILSIQWVKEHLIKQGVGFEVLTAVIMESAIFWDITLCSLLPAFTLLSCSAYSLVLKMEAIGCSETSVDFQQTTWRYMPEDSTLNKTRCWVSRILMFLFHLC